MGLDVVYERCAGCDIHKKTVTVHLVVSGGTETRTFSTTTKELLALVEWLRMEQVTHVAMESTGVYWKPLYNLLEATGLTVYVVNAAHMKAVPGRKTDVQDAVWICDLMRHGLLKPSFIPPRPQRELRELIRYRISLVAERAAEANRIQKVLEGGNIKLGTVVADILGTSGRAMLTALAAGANAPEEVAMLAHPRLRATREQLVAGRITTAATHLGDRRFHSLADLCVGHGLEASFRWDAPDRRPSGAPVSVGKGWIARHRSPTECCDRVIDKTDQTIYASCGASALQRHARLPGPAARRDEGRMRGHHAISGRGLNGGWGEILYGIGAARDDTRCAIAHQSARARFHCRRSSCRGKVRGQKGEVLVRLVPPTMRGP